MAFPTLSDSCDWDLAIPVDRYKKYNYEYWEDAEEAISFITSTIAHNITDNHNYSESISRASVYA
jgi:hypothetical protein